MPNSNYCKFEDWVVPILDAMLVEQKQQGIRWTPSRVRLRHETGLMLYPAVPQQPTSRMKTTISLPRVPWQMIERLGREIDDPSSIYYWCAL